MTFSTHQSLLLRIRQNRFITRGMGAAALLLIALTVVGHPAAATDFDGDRSGQTLTAPDNIFNFLAGFIGTNITVKSTVPAATSRFRNAPVAVTVDLSSTSTQTVYAGLTIIFDLNTSSGIYLFGSSYDDTLTGTSGDDAIGGGDGNDTINGSAGNDSLFGNAGSDTLNGDAGADSLNGGAGDDTLNGGADSDYFTDTSGNNMNVDLGAGTATGNGNDTLTGIENIATGGGNDTLTGDGSDNKLNGGGGNDTIDGGGGSDTFLDTSNNNMNVDLGAGTATGDGSDTLTGIENVITGTGNDTITGDANDNILSSGDGNDIINGGAGNDTIYGGDGNDIINGGAGNDTIYGGAGADTIDGGTETDTATNCVGDTLTNVEIDNCAAAPAPAVESHTNAPELCITDGTRIVYQSDRNIIVIYSDFGTTPNGMIITEIPLRSIPAPSDEEKASGQPIALVYKESEFAPHWSVGLYWQKSHYGVQVFKYGKLFDDTGADCGWF